jgi:hypothetical protein
LAVPEVTPLQMFARTAHETGLLGDEFHHRKSPAPLVSALGGIRCDRMEQAHLALAARLPDYSPDFLLKALQDKHTVVRTWGVRGALQIVPTGELPTYLAAAGVTAPRWRRFLDSRSNLTPPARLRLLRRLCPHDISRDALRDAIPDATTRLFMLREAAQGGHIVWKEGDGQQAVFAWTKEYLGKPVEAERDYHGLVGRYLSSYGPCDASDLASWLGVTVAAARRLMAKHRVDEVQVEGDPATTFMKIRDLDELVHFRKSRTKGMVVVPPGDPLLHAYKARYHLGEGGGEDTGLVYVDSRPAATWTLSRDGALVSFLDGTAHTRILKAVDAVVRRAGVAAEVREASAISGD